MSLDYNPDWNNSEPKGFFGWLLTSPKLTIYLVILSIAWVGFAIAYFTYEQEPGEVSNAWLGWIALALFLVWCYNLYKDIQHWKEYKRDFQSRKNLSGGA